MPSRDRRGVHSGSYPQPRRSRDVRREPDAKDEQRGSGCWLPIALVKEPAPAHCFGEGVGSFMVLRPQLKLNSRDEDQRALFFEGKELVNALALVVEVLVARRVTISR